VIFYIYKYANKKIFAIRHILLMLIFPAVDLKKKYIISKISQTIFYPHIK